MAASHIQIPKDKIEAFCKKWKVAEFSLFGSILRADFRPDSDVDVLVGFAPDGGITFENRVDMLDELRAIFGHDVDLVDKRLVRNPFRRQTILSNREIVYAA
jgi:hypothetical protein